MGSGSRKQRTPDHVRAAKYRRRHKRRLAATAAHHIWQLYAAGKRRELEQALAEAFGAVALEQLARVAASIAVTDAGVTAPAQLAGAECELSPLCLLGRYHRGTCVYASGVAGAQPPASRRKVKSDDPLRIGRGGGARE